MKRRLLNTRRAWLLVTIMLLLGSIKLLSYYSGNITTPFNPGEKEYLKNQKRSDGSSVEEQNQERRLIRERPYPKNNRAETTTNSSTGSPTYTPPLIRAEDEGVPGGRRGFRHCRLQLWFSRRCVAPDKNKILVVSPCDPAVDQQFSLTEDGLLMYDSTRQCAVSSQGKAGVLKLGACSDGVIFKAMDGIYLRTKVENKLRCMSPTVENLNELETNISNNCLGNTIALTRCSLKSSRLNIESESVFKEKVKPMINAQGVLTKDCDFPACRLNKPADPVVITADSAIECKDVFSCVTVITKTARRPHLVARLAQSIRDIRGRDLRIVAYDDGPPNYPDKVWAEIGRFPLLRYIIGSHKDVGISLGRNLALQQVQTPYFLLLDDDHILNNNTKLEKMLKILGRSDATLVGGKCADRSQFAGKLLFGFNSQRKKMLRTFSGNCDRGLAGFPGCSQCDIVSNIFLAKTNDIKKMGGWSDELKIFEHADFFVKLRAAGMKAIYCNDLEVINQQELETSSAYYKLRYGEARRTRMISLVVSRYNIDGLETCSRWGEDRDGGIECFIFQFSQVVC